MNVDRPIDRFEERSRFDGDNADNDRFGDTLSALVFIAAILAVWRMTHLAVVEDGPFDLFVKLRRVALAIRLDRLAACFYCASVWVALAVALFITREWRALVLFVPAFSGGAILLERATTRETSMWIEQEKETT